jgi:hypothetical protein
LGHASALLLAEVVVTLIVAVPVVMVPPRVTVPPVQTGGSVAPLGDEVSAQSRVMVPA